MLARWGGEAIKKLWKVKGDVYNVSETDDVFQSSF